MNPTTVPLCHCDKCKAVRALRLRNDLNAQADRRVLNSIQKDDLIFQDDDRPSKHNVLSSAAVLIPFCLLFFWGVWEAGKAIGQQAGLF